jgi:hypothetical protein
MVVPLCGPLILKAIYGWQRSAIPRAMSSAFGSKVLAEAA